MKNRLNRENLALTLIVILSAVLNFTNLGIEGYSNQYYAAAVKSMTLSLKNFFFAALDPAGFVTVDKPPLGFWMQALSAKIFGFHGWSILLPQALAGVLSVILIFYIVKRSFGSAAGLISALCLAITPVFVAVSRNNTIDNQLVLVLLLACWAFSVAAEKGKFKFLTLGMILVGIGFNIKMLQAYMIIPAVYILYLLSNSISVKKRFAHLIAGTVILLAVSLSWALVVDSIPAANRPYVGSSSNNTEMGLITGHNGTERLGGIFSIFSSGGNNGGSPGGGGPGGGPQMNRSNNKMPGNPPGGSGNNVSNSKAGGYNLQLSTNSSGYHTAAINNQATKQGTPGNPPDGNSGGPGMGMNNQKSPANGGPGGGPGGGAPGGGQGKGAGGSGTGLTGTFGNQTPAGITRLFAKNVLSDQIVWFIPLAILGFLAAAFKEKLRFRLDNKRKQALVFWFMWFLPEFIYFSYNTGLFHSYYLTMLAPPIAALTGIGLVSMWEMYREGGWKSWFLPAALLADGAVQMLMLTYFSSTSNIVKILMGLLIALCFVPAVALIILKLLPKRENVLEPESGDVKPNRAVKIKKILAVCAIAGLLLTPATGSAAAMFYAVDSSFPGAGLELLPAQQVNSQKYISNGNSNNAGAPNKQNNSTTDLIAFLNKHKVNGKSQIVVDSANTAENLILNSDVYVGSLSGFMGNETVMSLAQFKKLVKSGKVRYVLAGDNGVKGNTNSEIMTWVKATGKLVSYAGSTSNSNYQSSEQVYDLITYAENASGK